MKKLSEIIKEFFLETKSLALKKIHSEQTSKTFEIVSLCIAIIALYSMSKLFVFYFFFDGAFKFVLVLLIFVIILSYFFCYKTIVNAIFKICFGFKPIMKNGKRNKNKFDGKNGSFLTMVYYLIAIATFVVPIGLLGKKIESHTNEQYAKFGKTIKIDIDCIRHEGRYNTRTAYFNFEYEGKILEDKLSSKSLKVGDSTKITFSTKNPKIIKWTEEQD